MGLCRLLPSVTAASALCVVACGAGHAPPRPASRDVRSPALVAPSQGEARGSPSLDADSSPAAEHLAAWLSAFNSGDRGALHAYLDASAPKFSHSLDMLMSLRDATGGLDVQRLEAGTQTAAVAIVRERRSEAFYRATIKVEDGAPHRIVGIDLAPIDPPDDLLSPEERAGAQLDAARRASLLHGVARELLAHYVLLDGAKAMIAALTTCTSA
jgi:hypothetical protein